MVTSGLRIGTPALAARGFNAEDFREVADVIATALIERAKVGEEGVVNPALISSLRSRVEALAVANPLYPELEPFGAR